MILAISLSLLLILCILVAVHFAEVLAHKFGQPYGSLVLAVAVTTIEVTLAAIQTQASCKDITGAAAKNSASYSILNFLLLYNVLQSTAITHEEPLWVNKRRSNINGFRVFCLSLKAHRSTIFANAFPY